MDGKPVLLYSPQGLDKAELDYQNIYPNTYVIGQSFDADNARLTDVDYPTDRYDYQGAMSLVKELTFKNGKLHQYPVPAITSLRQSESDFTALPSTQNTYELELTFGENTQSELLLFADGLGNGLRLSVDTATGGLVLDRSQAGEPFATEFGTSRRSQVDAGVITANIFIDKSIFEIFINKGEKVFTGRVFPTADQTGIEVVAGQIAGRYFELKK